MLTEISEGDIISFQGNMKYYYLVIKYGNDKWELHRLFNFDPSSFVMGKNSIDSYRVRILTDILRGSS